MTCSVCLRKSALQSSCFYERCSLATSMCISDIYTANKLWFNSHSVAKVWFRPVFFSRAVPAWRKGAWDVLKFANHIWFSFRHFLGFCQQPRHFNGYNKPQSLIKSLLYVWKLCPLQLNIQSRLTPRPYGKGRGTWMGSEMKRTATTLAILPDGI